MAHTEEPRWMTIAKSQIGVAEYAGREHNPKIVEYHSKTSLSATDDETAWCSSFVGWCLNQCGLKTTNSAAAKSWTKWGARLESPKYGCLVVLNLHGANLADHVGFYFGRSKNDDEIWVLGGNQSNKVKISRFKKSSVLTYRWPS